MDTLKLEVWRGWGCIAATAQLLKESAWLLLRIGHKASPAGSDSNDVARALNRRCYPHTGNGGLSLCLSSSQSLSIGFVIHEKPMDVARFAPQGLTAIRTLYIFFLNWEITREHGVDGAPDKTYTNSIPDQRSFYPGGQCTSA